MRIIALINTLVDYKHIRIWFTALALTLASSSLISADEVRREMKAIHGVMEELFPLAVQSKTLSGKDKENLKTQIAALRDHVGKLQPSSEERSDPFQISLEMLTEHLNHSLSAIENKEYGYAISMVRELPQLCSTCHTQDERIKHFDTTDIKENLKSDFERGEYHFMTRDYQEALLDFNDHLAKQRKVSHGKGNSEAMEKILLIYLNVYRDPESAITYFDRLLDSGKLNIDFAMDVNQWLHGLDAVKTGPYKIDDIKDIEKEVDKILTFENEQDMPMFISEENKVSALWLRGLIYDFIKRNPKHKDAPKLLYWLAGLESSLEYGIYYQLPEIYLKNCVVKYPQHTYAEKCLEKFKSHVTLQYTGSSGTHIPSYKQVELDKLSDLIKQ